MGALQQISVMLDHDAYDRDCDCDCLSGLATPGDDINAALRTLLSSFTAPAIRVRQPN